MTLAPPALPGLVASEMHTGGRRLPDRNGFATALAVRALRHRGHAVPPAMLAVLERCRSVHGGFGFWPQGLRPHWAPALPDDADDTAIMALELYLAGRLTRDEVRRTACQRIGTRRIGRLPALRPPWLRTGVFATWSRLAGGQDMVDCTVITNVLALLTVAGLEGIPGADTSMALLECALDWAGDDDARASSLSPFYPDAAEWLLALDHAAAIGAKGMPALLRRALCTRWGQAAAQRRHAPDHAICSSPYGLAVWRSPALCAVRCSAEGT
ncbi:hypothetical protein [Hydrogenophaga sp. RWCD_12]|uniref:hypothetical protein n=1 Tax=Hydrogenophaga sp. RWCD_12 TaxID=3391190 RepID=UPI0039846885